jgi:SAM-dependent methyltransferase
LSNPSADSAITDFTYSGTELDAVAEASNYYDWIVDSFAGVLGKRIAEAGAGIGTVSQLILERAAPEALLLIEPARNNIPELQRRFSRDPRVRVFQGYLDEIGDSFKADTVIAVNVMEHVERDADFLRAARRTLSSDGSLLLLVPAVPAIYGSLDRAFDHFRRYTRSGLRRLLLDAGFEIERLHYLNGIGVAAWFLAGRVMHRKTLGRAQVRFYDRWVIPWLRRIESKIHPPIGQSLLAVARKPAVTPRSSPVRK